MSNSLNLVEKPFEGFESNQTDINFLDGLLNPQPVPEIPIDPDEDKFIIYEKQYDTHTKKRMRVKLTPAVCDVCGLDLLRLAYEQNKVAIYEFEDLSDENKLVFQQVVIKHKKRSHSFADNRIIGKSQKPKHWLGGRNE